MRQCHNEERSLGHVRVLSPNIRTINKINQLNVLSLEIRTKDDNYIAQEHRLHSHD